MTNPKESNARPNSTVICRIFGFPEAECNQRNRLHLHFDPVIDEREYEALRRTHPGWPDDPMSWNIFFSYKVPMPEEEGHLNFPDNFNISDEACLLAIFNKMSETEREELRDRILDETLQATFTKIRFEGYAAFIAGDKCAPANSKRRIVEALSEWRQRRSEQVTSADRCTRSNDATDNASNAAGPELRSVAISHGSGHSEPKRCRD
jgi:hypothetical protein